MVQGNSLRNHPNLTEQEFIQKAARFLENPGLLIRLTDYIGRPLDFAHNHLPERFRIQINKAVEKALHQALKISIASLPQAPHRGSWEQSLASSKRSGYLHTAATGITGSIGGLFGLAGLPFELPITTSIMLRSIANVARQYGTDLSRPTAQLECLYVFTLGTHSKLDDEMDSAYFSSRIAYGRMIHQASRFIASHSHKEVLSALQKGTAPGLIHFLNKISARFQVTVSEKVLAESLPLIGAIGGAAINTAFADYFHRAAHYHFGLKRLEAVYGRDLVMNFYLHKNQVRPFSA